MEKQAKKIAVISLGCDKNRVDTERMFFYLAKAGEFVTADESEAEIIIINTCAFIGEARKEAVQTILAAAQYKKDKCEKLIVTGCLPQKYYGEIKDELHEVDAFLGVSAYDKIGEVIKELYEGDGFSKPEKLPKDSEKEDESGRILTTPFDHAYLKIADGCNNHCTYCTIPSIRGKYRSRTVESLIFEAQKLVDGGVSELILVAQDVTNYGADLYGKPKLVPLIRELSKTGVRRIRLMYCYPDLIDGELIDEIKNNKVVAKYLDIPMQHSEDRILRLMGRRGGREDLSRLLNRLKSEIPEIVIRTTFMVGFPSETEDEFNALCGFVKEFNLPFAGVFAYSTEKDTPSAKIKGRIKASEGRRRKKELIKVAAENLAEFNRLLAGKTLEVLCEGIDFDKKMFFGRAYFNAPEVDPLIYFKGKSAESGQYYNVEITGIKGCGLVGKLEEE